MPKIAIPHPSNPKIRAEVGLDHALGWFADVIDRKRRFSYSAVDPGYDRERPLWGLLLFLSHHDFFSEDELMDALDRIQYEDPHELPEDLRRVARIVLELKAMADP